MKTFERIKELGHRLKTLESGCNTPVTDIQQSELQTAINDANVMHKYAKQIEDDLRSIYKKLFGNDWDPDGPARGAAFMAQCDAVSRQPAVFEITEENSQLPTDLVLGDEDFVDEIKDAMEGRR
jgi:hypothetical protein